MSTIAAQPLPYGLEREKHIEMLFRAFQRWKYSTSPQNLTTTLAPTQGPQHRDLSPTFQAADPETNRHKGVQWVTEALPAGLAALRTISQLHITAIPELQGMTCGPNLKMFCSSHSHSYYFCLYWQWCFFCPFSPKYTIWSKVCRHMAITPMY